MENHTSKSSRASASYNTLASALGVSGPLRLLPQGSAMKPHIVLKREYSKDTDASGSSVGTVRLVFVAGKRCSLTKGQPLLFAIASPDDPDGKTLLSDATAFLLEGQLEDAQKESEEEPAKRSVSVAQNTSRRINIDSLPPRMRRSMTYKEPHAGSSQVLPHLRSWLSAPEPTQRAHFSNSVQTDPLPIDRPHNIISPRRTPHTTSQRLQESPTQLPSPVSADHAREVIPDALVPYDDADVDEYARSDKSRSLSPMDLGSESCSPANSLMPLPATSPEGAKGGLLLESMLMQSASSEATQLTNDSKDASAAPSSPSPRLSGTARSLPQVLTPTLSEVSSLTAGATTEDTSEERHTNVATAAVVPQQVDLVGKELKAEECAHALETFFPPAKSPTPEPAVRTKEAENTPSASCTETQSPRVALQLSEARVGGTPEQASQKPPVTRPSPAKSSVARGLYSAPAFVKSASSSILGTWDATPSAPYIPTPTVGNPLGIRPSSSLPLPLQKPVPTGPRSLAGVSHAKKPVVVGAKWSAARNAGTSAATASNNSLSASASSSSLSQSSSLTSLPTSPSVPPEPAPSVAKTDLSQILRYASPSPPPTPPTPPPPLPVEEPSSLLTTQPANKWKRVDGGDKPLPTKLHLIGPAPERAADTETNALKRPHDSKDSNSTAEDERPSKKSKTSASSSPLSPEPPHLTPLVIRVKPLVHKPTPATPSTSILSPEASSSTSSSELSKYAKPQLPQQPTLGFARVMIPIPKTKVPLKHPLPPKPVTASSTSTVIGSSYRPSAKRDQKPDAKDTMRKSLRTDWPPTLPNKEYRLSNLKGEPSVQKILINKDGTQVAVVCADCTLRILENKPSVAEVARLPHNTQIASACWMDTVGSSSVVLTLCADGSLSTWTRSVSGEWKFCRLFTVPEARDATTLCMTYAKDRIAVSLHSMVKVWLLISGTWQPQREIARSGVTALKFVHGGNALVGGCSDSVLWYCEVPNGTLRVHAFLPSKKPIVSIDVHPTGQSLLVQQEGGTALLVSMRPGQNKGTIDRTYTSEKLQSMSQKGFAAVFATQGQAVLFGAINGCALVWDKRKANIVYGLKHPEGDTVQAAATFDGGPKAEGLMITGTKQGRLFWWPVPQAASTSHSASGAGTPDASERKRQKVA